MNKYFVLLHDILNYGVQQRNNKGDIIYLINRTLSLNSKDLIDIFNEYKVPKQLLEKELKLYMEGVAIVDKYKENGINWWDYCAPEIVNSYPTYFKKLPALIKKINEEKRFSKNYMLFVGETMVNTSQLPCISLIQFQIGINGLNMTIYQRSADSNLGLPCDIYQMSLISKMLNFNLNNITFFIGNAHIYLNNIEETKNMLLGKPYKYILNV